MVLSTPHPTDDEGVLRIGRNTEQCDNISDRVPEKALKCYFCGDWIYEGDEYYSLDNIDCCEDCLDLHYKQTAEPIDYQAELADLEYHDIKE